MEEHHLLVDRRGLLHDPVKDLTWRHLSGFSLRLTSCFPNWPCLLLGRGLVGCFAVPAIFDSLRPFCVGVELLYLLFDLGSMLGFHLARFDDSATARLADPRMPLAALAASSLLVSSPI